MAETTTPKPETDGTTERPWHTDKYHLYIWGPQGEMIADSRLDDAIAECPEAVGVPILRARGVGGRLPIEANMDFIIEAVNSHDTLKSETARLREQVKELREDAENWRSLMACPRIRPYGWAGLDENMQPNGKPGIHFGADFWSYGPVEDEQSGPKATQTGAALLKALVADIRARDLMEKTNA